MPKYDEQDNLLCDWCEEAVPVTKSGKILDWISPYGTYCSESHARAGKNSYHEKGPSF